MTTPPAVLVWSGKGGVGKSTVAVHLSQVLRDAGRCVGHLDADLHGPSAPTLFGTRERLGVRAHQIAPVMVSDIAVVSSGLLAGPAHPMVWQGLLLEGALSQLVEETDWNPCDVLVVDLPPGTGDIQTGLLERLQVIGTVVVSTPHDVSYDDVLRSAHLLQQANVPVTAVVTNLARVACPCCKHEFSPFPGDARERLRRIFPDARHLELALESECRGQDGVVQLPGMMAALRGVVSDIITEPAHQVRTCLANDRVEN